MAVGDFLEGYAQISTSQKQAQIGFAYRQIAGADPFNLAELLNDAYSVDIVPLLLAMLSNETQLQCLYTRKVRVAAGIPDTLNFANLNGAINSETMPGNSPFVVRLVTSANRSSANGRQFISGVPLSGVLDGELEAAYLAGAVDSYLNGIKLNITSAIDPTISFEPGVICRFVDGVKLDPPVFNDVTGTSTDGQIKSQQRRRTRQTRID